MRVTRLVHLGRFSERDADDVRARVEAADWLASAVPTRDAMAKILDGWQKRFQLIEVG